MTRHHRMAFGIVAALLALTRPAAAALDVQPVLPMIQAPAGSSVVVEALIQNSGDETMYLGAVSVDVPQGFTGSDPFAEFLAASPDSLLPGESWEGPVIRLTVAPDAPVADVRQVTLDFRGGLHEYDDQLLAEFTFALNDTTVLVAVPGTPRPKVAGFLRASPNPTRAGTLITFEIATPQDVDVGVYDVRGTVVRSLAHGRRGAGLQSLTWDGRDGSGALAASGLYFVRVSAPDGMRRTKVVRMQ